MGKCLFNSVAGDHIQVESFPQGVSLVVIPATPPFEDGVMDLFQLNLRHSSALLFAKAIEAGEEYATRDGLTSIFLLQGTAVLEFKQQYHPGSVFRCDLGPIGTQRLLTFFRATLKGDTIATVGRVSLDFPKKKLGRNDQCPCGSGKKYKKCHLGRPFDLPDELHLLQGIDDPYIASYLEAVRSDPRLLQDPDFLNGIATALGTLRLFDDALVFSEKALSIHRSPHYLLNYAVTLATQNRHQEALQILKEVPKDSTRKSIISANILQDMGAHEKAILLYEKAIEEEPQFFLPYVGILDSLKSLDSPLYEYWLNRGIRAVPTSAYIGIEYCYFLKNTMRLNELADADWIDGLSAESGRSDMIGRNADDPKRIIEAQLFRATAVVAVSENQEDLEDALAILAAANESWHLCDPAKLLVFTVANLGRPDLIEAPYQRICPHCREHGLGIPPQIESIRARAFIACDKYAEAVACCKVALKALPECELTLWDYWWALDELDHREEAVEVATTLYRLAPNTPQLRYNLGFLCGNIGSLGRAIHYYEEQLRTQSDHIYAAENVTFLYLLAANFESAREMWYRVLKGFREYYVPEPATDFDLCDGFIALKDEKFQRLLKAAEGSVGNHSYSIDLSTLNHASEPLIGSYIRIGKPKYSMADLLSTIHGDSPEKFADLRFDLQAQERGDFSPEIASLRKLIPYFDYLPLAARTSLIEAQHRMTLGNCADFSPVVVSLAKAVEIALKVLVFDAFREFFSKRFNSEIELESAKKDKKYDLVSRLCRFVSDGFHLEMGSMVLSLQLSTGKTAARLALLRSLNLFITNAGRAQLIEKDTLALMGDLASRFRNPAAHSDIFRREEAEEARGIVVTILAAF